MSFIYELVLVENIHGWALRRDPLARNCAVATAVLVALPVGPMPPPPWGLALCIATLLESLIQAARACSLQHILRGESMPMCPVNNKVVVCAVKVPSQHSQ